MNLLGIDIGGTKTSICYGNDQGEIRASRRFSMAPIESMEHYQSRLEELGHDVLSDAGVVLKNIDAVGISAPGPLSVSKGTLLAPPNNPGWKNVPIVKMVQKAFGRPISMNNDANGGALAEKYFGSHRDCENLLYLTCSTGMGGGIIANGQLVQGVSDMGGEIGHQILDADGPPCPCGLRGCFEVYCGGRNLAERLKEKIKREKIETLITQEAGGRVDAITHATFTAAARAGDPFAMQEWDTFVKRMAQGIGNLIMTLNPEVILLGTIAIKEGDFLMLPLRAELEKHTWPWNYKACEVVPSSLGS